MADVLDRPRTVKEYGDRAQKVLSPPYFQLYNYPGPDGQTFTDSEAAFKRYRFRPHLLSDVSTRQLSTTVLGEPVSVPIGIAPTALQRFAHKDAEIAKAKGAEAVGTLMIQSSYANKSLQEMRAGAPRALLWQNIYIWKDRRITKALIRKAEEVGCKALVITVDSPTGGVDISDFKRNYILYDHEECSQPDIDLDLDEQREAKKRGDPNLYFYFRYQMDSSLKWKDVTWVKTLTSLPIVCKGILTAEAAKQAVNAGADGIIVSCHGGRQLDGVPAPIDALSEVVEAVRGRNVEVYMDGGVRRGTDVLKALAIGAKAVFVGRPAIWGLACGGASGVEGVLSILRNELDYAMALCGCTDVNNIPKDTVVHESFYNLPKHKL